jgi:hypothetical protein
VTESFSFDAAVFEWEAKASAFFVALPPDISEEIGVRFGARAAGFGSLRVEVTVGTLTWKTSVFPSDARGYVLPLKKAVRKAANLDAGDVASVTLRVIA